MVSFLKLRKLIFIFGFVFLFSPVFILADSLGEEINFNLDKSFDLTGRGEAKAFLEIIGERAYFYLDKNWWQALTYSEKQKMEMVLSSLSQEFDKKIYPTLTNVFGSEAKPGIDKDEKITILIHPMGKGVGGYTQMGDIYEKIQNPKSNQREMVYLNSDYLDSSLAKGFLAHEFTHLITINQKTLLRGVIEEIWLNEARAEYSITLLGYNNFYQGSNLERRVNDFLNKPTVSLTEWLNRNEDYGIVNLFSQYLVDHYGDKILVDSLQSNKVGIESINHALSKNNYQKDFAEIFSDWLIALLVNDCRLGDKYCYKNNNLKNFRITPTIYYLPKETMVLSTYHLSTYWAPNWHRFIGGENLLTLEFEGHNPVSFKIPYLLCDIGNQCSIYFMEVDKENKGKIVISDFNSKYNSLTVLPFILSRTTEFNGKQSTFSFTWQVSVNEGEVEKDELINQLLEEVERLKSQIAEMQAKIAAILLNQGNSSLSRDLYYGMSNSTEVSFLQQFLKDQGVYPEGLITGNFLSLTKEAVIRFQEKYASEILAPFSLSQGTGYVGEKTRAKINQLTR